MANYSYLADGTRTSAIGSGGSGLVRRGSLTYRTGANSSLEFEGADFGACHYSPALTRWLTPDPLSEKYYGISPYTYCNGDPVNLVDPDGLAIWELKSDGSLSVVDDTVSETIVNYSDKNGNKTSITLSGDGFLVGLKSKESYDGKVHYNKLDNTASNMSDALTFFFFAADHTDIEWVVHYDDDSIALGTKYSTDNAGSWEDYGLSKVPKVSIHSHPNTGTSDFEKLDSVGAYYYNGAYTGDYHKNIDFYNYTHGRTAAEFFIYFPKSSPKYSMFKFIRNNNKTSVGYYQKYLNYYKKK